MDTSHISVLFLFTLCCFSRFIIITENKYHRHGMSHTRDREGKIRNNETSENMASPIMRNFTSVAMESATSGALSLDVLSTQNVGKQTPLKPGSRKSKVPLPYFNDGAQRTVVNNATLIGDEVPLNEQLEVNSYGHKGPYMSGNLHLTHKVVTSPRKKKKQPVKRVDIPLPFAVSGNEIGQKVPVWPNKLRRHHRNSFKHLPPLA